MREKTVLRHIIWLLSHIAHKTALDKAIDQVRAEGQQLVNQAMGGILQDSINEMGAKAVLKSGGNPFRMCWEAWAVCNPQSKPNGKSRKKISSSLAKMFVAAL